MARLHCVVEGQSEETFVNRILAPHLHQHSVWPDARSVYTSRDRAYWWRGGVTSFERLHRDVTSWLKQDQHADAYFTTMLDLYRLPSDFPGYDAVRQERDPYRRATVLERALAETIPDRRFVPYLQIHEFEALILTEPQKLDVMYPDERRAIENLIKLRGQHRSPETIDLEDPPSKRIKAAIPAYSKTAAAAQVAEAIGVEAMKTACPHFAEWLAKLEILGA